MFQQHLKASVIALCYCDTEQSFATEATPLNCHFSSCGVNVVYSNHHMTSNQILTALITCAVSL